MEHESTSAISRDAELLERHLLDGGTPPDVELDAFRRREASLTRLADNVMAELRTPLRPLEHRPSFFPAQSRSRENNHGRSSVVPTGAWRAWRPRLAGLGAVAALSLMLVAGYHVVTNASGSAEASELYATNAGELRQLTLPDGSTVLLAPGSQLRHDARFGTDHRTVTLIGEALFTVTHSTGTPFLVKAGPYETRVLGTAFTVRRYANDTIARVVVAAGRVSLDEHIMVPGDEAQAVDGRGIEVHRSADIGSALAWTQGMVIFESTPFRNVVQELSRWYGLDVQVSDPSLLDKRITAIFTKKSANYVIPTLESALEAIATRHGNRVTFTPVTR